MGKIKLEHIDNLRRGRKSGNKIGSRGVPHHLYKYEEEKYKRALKYRYLEIQRQDRVNLRNLWQKVCIAKGWENYMLVKDVHAGTAEILLDETLICSGDMKTLKTKIKNYV